VSKLAPAPASIVVSEMDYRGNRIVFAKNSNAVTIFSQHVLFYAIDNPEFAEYLVNAGITTFVMADGSTMDIATLKRSKGYKDTIVLMTICLLVFLSLLLAASAFDRTNSLKRAMEEYIKEEK